MFIQLCSIFSNFPVEVPRDS